MAEFLNAVSAVFVIFILLSVGYFLGRMGWMTASEKKFVSKYVVNLAVPLNCLTGLLKNFTRDDLAQAGVQILVAMAIVTATLLLGGVAATILRLPQRRWGVFVAMAGISNTMFIGLPMTQQLFGPVSLPYMMTYYLASTGFTQIVALMLCERAGGHAPSGFHPVQALKDILTKPPVLGVLLAVVLLLTDLRPPKVLMDAGGYISSTVTPLALMYCGFILYEVGLKNLRFMPGLPTMLVIRLILSPLICVGLCALTGITDLPRDVFVIMSALPVVTQVTVMAGLYGADEQYAAVGSSLSLLGIFITVPVIMTLL